MEKVIISNKNLKRYEKRMKQIENNIWDLLENYLYYSKIRGIMHMYKQSKTLSKRQVIRLYEFIEGEKPITYTNDILDCAYKRALTELKNELLTSKEFLEKYKKEIEDINKTAKKLGKTIEKYTKKN